MQKLKLQNKWNKDTNSFDKNQFELKETEKLISGKVNVTSKQNDKFVSKAIPFVLFKSKADAETQNAVKSCQPFLASFNLAVNEFKDKDGKTITYHQIIINEAKLEGIDKHSQEKGNGYQPEQEPFNDDSEIPF